MSVFADPCATCVCGRYIDQFVRSIPLVLFPLIAPINMVSLQHSLLVLYRLLNRNPFSFSAGHDVCHVRHLLL
jgi:hypothetical protein